MELKNNCNFTNNTATENGGAIYWFGNNGTVNNSNFNNNQAAQIGGAIYWNVDIGKIYESDFKCNTAENYKNIYLNEKFNSLKLSDSTLESNVTISQIPDCVVGSSATVNFTFDDGTTLGDYNVTLYNNNQLLKTFPYKSTYNYTWDNLTLGNYSITVNNINSNRNKYIASYDTMKFNVINCFIKDNNDMSVFYMENVQFTVRLVDTNEKPVSAISLTFKVNDITYNATSDANGYASILIDWKPDKYTISTICGNSTVLNSIQVKNVVYAPKSIKVKKSQKSTKLKISLEGIKSKTVKKSSFKYTGKVKVSIKIGNDLAGKKVSVKLKGHEFNTKVNSKGIGTIKINKKLARELKLKKSKKYKDSIVYKNKSVNVKIDGKTYSIKTGSKGTAVFKITKNMVKNLKVSKNYPYYVEFGEDIAKNNLIIKK